MYVYVYVDNVYVFVFLYVYVCITFISWNLRHLFAPKGAPVQVYSTQLPQPRSKSAVVPWISSILNPIVCENDNNTNICFYGCRAATRI